jgi:PhzF family phenazine biosynthesis protein
MRIPVYFADAFTTELFSGNPAAVCLLEESIDCETMQKIAAELNLSETAFTFVQDGKRMIRWFTPLCEVDLCGHATLATTHVMNTAGLLQDGAVSFMSKSGELTAAASDNAITLNFPIGELSVCPEPDGLMDALGVTGVFEGEAMNTLLVLCEDEKTVREVFPDFTALKKIPFEAVVITAPSDKYDFVSRMFGPAIGIDEDPVTGMAHCILGEYWRRKTGKNVFKAYQASKRGGGMVVEIKGGRALLTGQAVITMKGEMNI